MHDLNLPRNSSSVRGEGTRGCGRQGRWFLCILERHSGDTYEGTTEVC